VKQTGNPYIHDFTSISMEILNFIHLDTKSGKGAGLLLPGCQEKRLEKLLFYGIPLFAGVLTGCSFSGLGVLAASNAFF
jgi:hypothetical protein